MSPDDRKKTNEVLHMASEVGILLVRHRVDLYAYALAATRNHHDAEDLVQDVSRVAVLNSDQYQPGTNFRAWAREIARRRILERVRNSKHAGIVCVDPDALERLAEAARVVEDRQTPMWQEEAMRECVQKLRGTLRNVVDFRYGDGLDIEQIARRIPRSVSATYSLLKRAKNVIRDCAKERILQLSAAERSNG